MQTEITKYIHDYTSNWARVVGEIKQPTPDAMTMQLNYAPTPSSADELQNVGNDAPWYAPREIAVDSLIQLYCSPLLRILNVAYAV